MCSSLSSLAFSYCHWLQESPCDLFQCQELMEAPALSRNPLWHGRFRAEPVPDGSLKRTGCSVQRQDKWQCGFSVFLSPLFLVPVCTERFQPLHPGIPTLLQPGICSLPLCPVPQAGFRALWSCE